MDRDLELALVERLRAGDPGAFDAVHAEFHARLINFLARLSRRRDVAEDLVEETWLRLVSQHARLDRETRLGSWLFTVARNIYVSYCRSRMVEAGHAGDLMGLWPAGPVTRTPFDHAAGNESTRRLEDALATLPTHYREVLLLVGVEGLKPAEAAVVCGVSPEALRQRLSRARQLLAERLAQREATKREEVS